MDPKRADSKKIQFEFSAEAYRRLEALEQETDAATKAEVIRKALRLLEWFTKIDSNDFVVVQDQEGHDLQKIRAGALR
jgi:hypothetical protein